jgi:ubiquinol-cytochrome c reductase cytochrome c1 subunit
MKRLIVALCFAVLPGLGVASEEMHLDRVEIDLSNKQSLQNGAKLFTNYCLSCHSAGYARYNRMGKDLGLTDEQVQQNLMFAGQKIGDQMKVAMPAADAKAFFGVVPPDLSVVARSRGADWLYTYLRTFYVDEKRPFGVNNKVFPDVGMPHVLWELQGLQKPVFKVEHDKNVLVGFEPVQPEPDAKKAAEKVAKYDENVHDLVNFMVYLGEPARMERQRLGWWVLGFLAIFFVVAYMLKKEYWKDVH